MVSFGEVFCGFLNICLNEVVCFGEEFFCWEDVFCFCDGVEFLDFEVVWCLCDCIGVVDFVD